MREYDPVIGRWLAKDPKNQFHSPYLGMGNNPLSGTDPDGGWLFGLFGSTSSDRRVARQMADALDGKVTNYFTSDIGVTWDGPLWESESPNLYALKNVYDVSFNKDGSISDVDITSVWHSFSGTAAPDFTIESFVIGGAVFKGGVQGANWALRSATTSEGFLFGSVGFRLPFSVRVGLYASEKTLKYGTFKFSTIAPKFFGNSTWFGRRMLQITEGFQPC